MREDTWDRADRDEMRQARADHRADILADIRWEHDEASRLEALEAEALEVWR